MKTTNSLLSIHTGLTDQSRKKTVSLLQKHVADHYVLVTKTKFYHWNVDGPHFHDLHTLFDDHYETISDMIDTLAEQCLKLGGQSTGTLARFLEDARLTEDKGDTIPETKEMVQNLLDAHEEVIRNLGKDIEMVDEDCKDPVTSNMLQDISDKHQKMAWMLRMIVQKSNL